MGLSFCEKCGSQVSHGHFVNNRRMCFSCKFKYDREQEYKMDNRYNQPKENPSVSQEEIERTIAENPIYSEVRNLMFSVQNKQVGYGLEKYPEPLNADTWSTIETIDHILEETVDKLHYLVMLKIKLKELYNGNER